MNWFKRKQAPVDLSTLTPLELVTQLVVCLQLADNRVDYSEREAWSATLTKLFPDHTPGHALEVLENASREISDFTSDQKFQRAREVSDVLLRYYSREKFETGILGELQNLIEADGIVLSEETNLLNRLKDHLAQ